MSEQAKKPSPFTLMLIILILLAMALWPLVFSVRPAQSAEMQRVMRSDGLVEFRGPHRFIAARPKIKPLAKAANKSKIPAGEPKPLFQIGKPIGKP